MKNFPGKAAIIAGALSIALAGLLEPSVAQTPGQQPAGIVDLSAQPVKARPAVTVEVGASAAFIQGAEMKIEHEPLDTAVPEIDTEHAVTRMASITINGLRDETALMTCGVESAAGGRAHRRDCAGAQAVRQHVLEGGKSFDSGILLTNDLLPNPSGLSEGSISIEVTYL